MQTKWKVFGATGVGVLLLVLGLVGGAMMMVYMQPYPWPSGIDEKYGGDFAMRTVWYPLAQVPWTDKTYGVLVVEFRKFNDEGKRKRIRVSGSLGTGTDIFYGDNRELVTRIGDHTVFVYEQQAGSVKRYDFNERYKLLAPTSDHGYFIARVQEGEDSGRLALLNWSGAVAAMSGKIEGEPFDWVVLQDEFVFLPYFTQGPPVGLFAWNFFQNTLREDRRPEIKKIISGYADRYELFRDNDGKMILGAERMKSSYEKIIVRESNNP